MLSHYLLHLLYRTQNLDFGASTTAFARFGTHRSPVEGFPLPDLNQSVPEYSDNLRSRYNDEFPQQLTDVISNVKLAYTHRPQAETKKVIAVKSSNAKDLSK